MAKKAPPPVAKIDGAGYVHCRACVVEGRAPSIEALLNRDTIQVWCRNHDINVGVFHLEVEMPKQVTVVNDAAGKLLAVLADVLEQVRVGRDFYVGQTRYVVAATTLRTPDEMVITVRAP